MRPCRSPERLSPDPSSGNRLLAVHVAPKLKRSPRTASTRILMTQGIKESLTPRAHPSEAVRNRTRMRPERAHPMKNLATSRTGRPRTLDQAVRADPRRMSGTPCFRAPAFTAGSCATGSPTKSCRTSSSANLKSTGMSLPPCFVPRASLLQRWRRSSCRQSRSWRLA